MSETLLSRQITDHRISLYEKIIADLQDQQYSVIDHFFETKVIENCMDEMLGLYNTNNLKKAAIGSKTNEIIRKEIRGDFIKWIDRNKASAYQKRLLDGIDHFVDYLNKTCFLGIIEKEFHYAVYPKHTFYRRHLDAFQQNQRRKLSMVIYLNKEWQNDEGGELVIYTKKDNQELAVPIEPVFGRLVVFESQVLEHEVKRVNKGLRLSVTGWLKTN